MHIFLTGPLQVGKSTVIEKTLKALGQPIIGGFRTVSLTSCLPQALAEVYLVPAGAPGGFDRFHLAGIRWGDGLFTAYPEVFDTAGVELLQNVPAGARLILMDELGFMEKQDGLFAQAVLAALDGPVPVLGVIKPRSARLLDRVRAHSRVQILEVRPDNRNQLPNVVLARLGLAIL